MRKLFRKKGYTLVEVLVTVAITSIIIAAVAGLFQPMTQLMNSLKNDANLDTACDTANEFIRGCIERSDGGQAIAFSSPSDSAIVNYAASLRADMKTGDKMYAVVVAKNADGNYRIYQMEMTGNNISGYNSDANAVFNEAFYAGTSLLPSLDGGGTIDADGNVSDQWVRLTTQCFEGTEVRNQARTLTFKIFNGELSVPVLTDRDFAIIYCVRDLSDYYTP